MKFVRWKMVLEQAWSIIVFSIKFSIHYQSIIDIIDKVISVLSILLHKLQGVKLYDWEDIKEYNLLNNYIYN